MDCGVAVYEHAACLIGRRPWDVSRDAELMFQAHAVAYRRYHHAPIVASIDIYNLEAEAYGAVIYEPQGNGIPAVTQPICDSVDALAQLPLFDPATAGRIPMTLEVAEHLRAEFPEADVRIPMAGPMSIASSLMGIESLLCDMISRPDAARAALIHMADGQVRFCEAIARAGLDVAFFESAASPPLVSPAMFRQVELPALSSIIDRCSQVLGHPISCVMGGDTEPVLDALLETGTGYVICPIETDQAAFMEKIRDRTEIRVRVNTSPALMAQGTPQQIQQDVERIIRLCGDRPNVCVGTSALPYETPPENVLWIQELCNRHK